MTILFDLDGTLIDSTEAILESFHNSFEVFKRPHPSDDAIKALIGHPLDSMYRDLNIEEELVWDFVRTYKAHYQTIYMEKTVLLDCAVEAIQRAQEMARLGIVTTKTGTFSRELMQHFGVMDAFEVLIGRENVENPKPHAEPIEKAMDAMGSKRAQTWMIGDTRLDIASALSAGVQSVAVSSGYESKEQLSTLTDIIQNDALEAVNYIFRH